MRVLARWVGALRGHSSEAPSSWRVLMVGVVGGRKPEGEMGGGVGLSGCVCEDWSADRRLSQQHRRQM